MKKLIALALVLVLAPTLAVCQNGGTSVNNKANILNYEITIPATYGKSWTDDVTAENAAYGMKSITKNDDGTATVAFDNYGKYMGSLRTAIIDALAKLPENVENCVEATINDSFNEITIIDKGTDYDQDDYGFTMFGFYLALLEYQIYDEVPEAELNVIFTIKSEATGEILVTNREG